jgi:hypothetical protein
MHHLQEWNTLSDKEREKALRQHGLDPLAKPQGWQIDQILKAKRENANQQATPKHAQYVQQAQQGGPGSIPA